MRKLAIACVAASALSVPALAQTAAPPPSTVAPPAASTTTTAPMLTEDQAKAWVDRVVYSSDNKNIGEVGSIARDASGRVTELHVDTGGFLGIGETRVRVMPSQFRFDGDRVVLNLTAEQAKGLPKIAK